jgi:hypothetical protein
MKFFRHRLWIIAALSSMFPAGFRINSMTLDHRVAGSSPAGCTAATRADPQAIWRSTNPSKFFWYTHLIPTLGFHDPAAFWDIPQFARCGPAPCDRLECQRAMSSIVIKSPEFGDFSSHLCACGRVRPHCLLAGVAPIWTDAIPCVELKSDYAHFFPISSRPAFLRSSGVMTTLNSTFALKVRNQGSARVGIFDGSDISTIMTAPR